MKTASAIAHRIRLEMAARSTAPSSPFGLITQLEGWYSLRLPTKVTGRVDLGTAGIGRG